VSLPLTPQLMTQILAANAGLACFMTGLIWFVQIVHYPLMAAVGAANWNEYELKHQKLTTLVVAPAMLLEALAAAALVVAAQMHPSEGILATPRGVWMAWAGAGLLVVVWLSTFALQVPEHERLSRGPFDAAAHRRLVGTNWIRTAAWTARGLLGVVLAAG